MAHYRARMMDAETGGEGIHEFEAADDLLDHSPMTVVRTFFQAERAHDMAHLIKDYELNAAMKNKDRKVVTALGSLILTSGMELPFLLMIAAK